MIDRVVIANRCGQLVNLIALDFNGVAIELIPRTASEIKSKAKYTLLSVNEAEEKKNPARRYVVKRGSRWELTSHGLNLLDLLTY